MAGVAAIAAVLSAVAPTGGVARAAGTWTGCPPDITTIQTDQTAVNGGTATAAQTTELDNWNAGTSAQQQACVTAQLGTPADQQAQHPPVGGTGASGQIVNTAANPAGVHVVNNGGGGHNGISDIVIIPFIPVYSFGTGGGGGGNGASTTVGVAAGNITPGGGVAGVSVISNGGNGGSGGDAFIAAYGQGGDGGGGGNGGSITLSNNATVTTNGGNAVGLFALSAGGTGGSGGDVVAGIGSQGGSGAGGGRSGNVDVQNYGVVSTNGQGAAGIMARTLGGSGGKGGSAGLSLVGAGGDGGPTGIAGNLSVELHNNIETFGADSAGIYAQSIGGFAGAHDCSRSSTPSSPPPRTKMSGELAGGALCKAEAASMMRW